MGWAAADAGDAAVAADAAEKVRVFAMRVSSFAREVVRDGRSSYARTEGRGERL
ncbi:hypothetical protein P376_1826 [Streptomyces sp. HCCB10043]|nr:hypothetical protein P376_1826 [Streptomyces sp. HCCB10043]